jgi:transcriptional regulator with XRE-family HTH domain
MVTNDSKVNTKVIRMTGIFDPVAIGQRLREVRGGESQTEFADRLGVNYRTLANYESGKRVPDVEFMHKLMEHRNVDPAWLISGRRGVESSNNLSLGLLKELRITLDQSLDRVIANLEKRNEE